MLRKLLIALGLAAALVALAEGFVRVAAGPPASFLYSGSFRDHQTDWDITYGVTSNNRRLSCPSGESAARRIAVIGDSFVFGQGVPDCQDVVSRLNDRFAGRIRFENLGVIGIGLDEYRMIVRDYVDDSYYGVIIALYGNDIPGPRSFPGRLADRSSLFALLRKAWRAYRVRKAFSRSDSENTEPFNNIRSILASDPDYFVRITNPDNASLELLRASFSALLHEINENVASERVWVTVVPSAAVLAETVREFISANGGALPPSAARGGFHKTARAVTKRNQAHFVDSFDDLAETENAYHPHDLHLNAAGHHALAQSLARQLEPATEND